MAIALHGAALAGAEPHQEQQGHLALGVIGHVDHGKTSLVRAISGMETALWDLVGKHFQVPVWQLLGGQFRDQIRLYADCHAGEGLGTDAILALTRGEP